MKRGLLFWLSMTLVAACGADDGDTDVTPPSTSIATTTSIAPTTTVPRESMRGGRYCEVLLLAPSANGIVATVFNSYPLGDCPDEQWGALDPTAIAAEQDAALALLNGPRYWLMDEVGRDVGDVTTETFGAIEMNRYATVTITDTSSIGRAYTPQTVDRKATFVFRAGRTIFTLVSDDGRRFVMQSFSQQVDPELSESDLAELGARLALPDGWTFEPVTLTEDLVIGESREPAQVLQDELLNSYSLVA